MTLLKICGIQDFKTASLCAFQNVSYLGFILHYKKSPRNIDPSNLSILTETLSKYCKENGITKPQLVGVFVNLDIDTALQALTDCHLDIAQLHGEESPEYCNAIRSEGFAVWKGFRVSTQFSTREVLPFLDTIDGVLVDSFSPNTHGGTGKTFEWKSAIKAKSLGLPLILSGGITLSNICNALIDVHPDVIDISSGVESTPGVKDHQKIIEIAKRITYPC